MKRFTRALLTMASAAIFFPQAAIADERVTLAWDPNTQPQLAGYRLHYGTASGIYGTQIDVGNVTTYTVSGLAAGRRYFFAVKAYDTSGEESGFSNEVSTVISAPDFQIGAPGAFGSFSSTVTAGSRATYNLAVTGLNDFSGSVSFTYSGLPSSTSCTVFPNPLRVSGTAAVPFQVAITTTARAAAIGMIRNFGRFPRSGPAPTIALGLGTLILMVCMPRRRRLSMAMLLLSGIGLVGCGRGGGSGSSSGSSSQITPPAYGTPAGTYTVVITAISDGISHSADLTLMVN